MTTLYRSKLSCLSPHLFFFYLYTIHSSSEQGLILCILINSNFNMGEVLRLSFPLFLFLNLIYIY